MARRSKRTPITTILPAQCADLGIAADTQSQTDSWGVVYIVGKGRSMKCYRIEWDSMPILRYDHVGAVYASPF